MSKRRIAKIVKRDGGLERFDAAKINESIRKAFVSAGRIGKSAEQAYGHIVEMVQKRLPRKLLTTNDIRDMVEEWLIRSGEKDVAKAYILYRAKKDEIQQALQDSLGGMKKALQSETKTYNELRREVEQMRKHPHERDVDLLKMLSREADRYKKQISVHRSEVKDFEGRYRRLLHPSVEGKAFRGDVLEKKISTLKGYITSDGKILRVLATKRKALVKGGPEGLDLVEVDKAVDKLKGSISSYRLELGKTRKELRSLRPRSSAL